MKHVLARVALAGLVIGLLWFGWPTPYISYGLRWENKHMNRFTGAVCRVTESCWTPGR